MMKRALKNLYFSLSPLLLLPLLLLEGCVLDRLISSSPPILAPSSSTQSYTAVTTQKGDTLQAIAQRYDVTTQDLIKLNKLKPPYKIEPGQGLRLPPKRSHIVRPFETIESIAEKRTVDLPGLVKLNSLKPPYVLKAGQRLKLPSSTDLVSEAPVETSVKDSKTDPTIPRQEKMSKLEKLTQELEKAKKERTESRGVADEKKEPESPPEKETPKEQDVSKTPDISQTTERLKLIEKIKPLKESTPPPEESDTELSPPEEVKESPKVPEETPTEEVTEKTSEESSPVTSPPQQATSDEPSEPTTPLTHFSWPVQGEVVGKFGRRSGGLRNDGINISASKGTDIKAAEFGHVVYVGNALKGFGNLILIRHRDGWITTYAHCDQTVVSKGDQVTKGQKIASVGTTGSVKTPQLHFEVRKKTQTVDPLEYLK